MDIGPGDRVRVVDASSREGWPPPLFLAEGQVWTVAQVRVDWEGRPVLRLAGYDHAAEERVGHDYLRSHGMYFPGELHAGWSLDRFRKLPDISEWLETSTGYEEPRRVPAPREVEGV